MSEVKELWGWDCKCGGLTIPVTPVTEYQKLKAENANLKQALAVVVEVLSFYGNKMSYSIDYDSGISGEMMHRRVLYSDSEEHNEFSSYAGIRARQALEKIKEMGLCE